MRKLFLHILFLLFVGFMTSCEKLEDTYSEYRGDGPIQYLTKIYNLTASPQWLSVELNWELKLDPGRTAIMIKWTDDEKSDSVLIDKESTSYVVKNLKNYEYSFNVYAVEKNDEQIVKYSLGDPVYARPYTYESDELLLFTRVVNKSFKVADKSIFVVFEEWADNLISFKIGYYEKNNNTEQFWNVNPEDKIGHFPFGKACAMIGTNIDFSKPINVYRTGRIAFVDDMELELNPIELFFNVPSFDSNFAAEVRSQFDLQGEIQQTDINDITSLCIDYDQISLADVLHFPNLKELYLGKNRFLSTGTEDQVKSSLTEVEVSTEALRVLAEELGVKIYHYGKHYFDNVPEFFTTKNQIATLPSLTLLETSNWNISITPADALGYISGLENLLTDNNSYWTPQPGNQIREHVITIDMKRQENILGFKIVQAQPTDATIPLSSEIKIEYETGSGQWNTATFSEKVTLGTGKGETTIVYLNKAKESKTTQRIRLTISDNFYKKGYDASYNYVDFYTTTLASFMVIQKQ